MNGIFPADLAVYLLLAPIVVYIFYTHRWSGFLPWYYLSVFCLARIIGGILGVYDSDGLPANIIQSVGITPLILAADGLVHEGRVYRNPNASRLLGWSVVIATTSIMLVAVALTITGSLHIYEGIPQSGSYTEWKVGTVLTAVCWAFQLLWSLFSLLPSSGLKGAPGYHGGTALIQGAFVALIFIAVRVIYGLVYVFTGRRDLSPIYGSLAVRILLMFLPEVFAAVTMIVVGVRTRHIRETKHVPRYHGVGA
ncbi:uncharacterized protein N7496_003513 [Penicillium cataractarum]|uniref:DUF7702 domain-containing protein n=1 Tax=Penicillium cataractarum TaxID=2100454 RepID=A0A9W9VIX1_9EURO|nr:uncharacterized protein N7496_003513 [Penicillium cataractarum]KAJ5381085.1 hypothetical protein N7496_003513 [Penicillium cataractarum]